LIIIITHFDTDVLSLKCLSDFVLPAVQLHLYSGRAVRTLVAERRGTNSCFNSSRSSFIFKSRRSTSLRSAELAARTVAESFFAVIVISARSSERAARNRYACYLNVDMQKGDIRNLNEHTLSRSLTVKPSLRTLLIRSTRSAFVVVIKLLATGVGNDFSRAVTKA
jgi:hypothetical protein